MADFLERMARASRERADRALHRESRAQMRKRAADTMLPPPLRLRDPGFDLIAEIKRVSPSSGVLPDGDAQLEGSVAHRARAYADAGAVAVSVLTEPDEFGGSLSDLVEASHAVAVPVMRKDFLVDRCQVFQARAAGAAGVLLILRILDAAQLSEMLDAACEMRLFVLLEAFDWLDLQRAVEASRLAQTMGVTTLVGLNCRDLATLQIDRTRFDRLRPEKTGGAPAVAESGLESPVHAREVASLGYRLALVGSALMRAPDPRRLIQTLLAAGRNEVDKCASR